MHVSPRYAKRSNAHIAADIEEAVRLSAVNETARSRLPALALEAGGRLLAMDAERTAARKDRWRGIGHRAFMVFWWLHAAAVVLLLSEALHQAGLRFGNPEWFTAVALLVAGGLIVLRWMLTGGWRFGPRL
jgi:hypothetical protein